MKKVTITQGLDVIDIHSQKLENTEMPKGVKFTILFYNGYGASIVQNEYSYGGTEGLWELAVVDSNGDLIYDTPVTSDVIGHVPEDEIITYLKQINALPKRLVG